ncbi:MAG TPA: hypothetical protein VHI93_05990, partial [Candidatus Thermoplasmatota archaeon]|nr:hypothetical protein [Candidatus Thermoplasmatota archaeon]
QAALRPPAEAPTPTTSAAFVGDISPPLGNGLVEDGLAVGVMPGLLALQARTDLLHAGINGQLAAGRAAAA